MNTGGVLTRAIGRVVEIREEETGAVLLSCAYFFCLLSAYFIIRPMREQMGVAGGVRNLPWLYTGTLVSMLLVHPPFAALVARLPRRRFIALSYRFFLVNLLIFFAIFKLVPEPQAVWAGRVFFVWTSVFSLFVVSVFWAFMVDLFRADQGRRLFGFIGIGGTLGAIAGAGITALLSARIGPVHLLLVSAALLELAVRCVRALSRGAEIRTRRCPHCGASLQSPADAPCPACGTAGAESRIGGSALAGITHVARSPYLLGICLYMLLFTVGSTVLYFQQATIADREFSDRAMMTSFFARIDLAVNVLTLLTQGFLTGRLIKWLGVTVTLALLPAVSAIGFVSLGTMPVLAVFVIFQVFRRAGEYSVARPAREVLYTVVPREDKYKAKHFIDTVIYRSGDQVGAWSMAGLTALGLGLAGTAWAAAPLSAAWLVIAVWLGRKQAALTRSSARAVPVGAPAEAASP